MNIITKLFTKLNDYTGVYGWVPIEKCKSLNEDYMDLQAAHQLLSAKYKDSKIFIEKLEEELITVTTNYSNYVSEKTKEINTLKATIESLDETVISLNTEQDRLLHRIKIMKGTNKYLLAEKEKELDKNKLLTKSISSYARLNKYLWALLFISISGNFYQALI
jgi:chromosome segregation ATPase